MQWYVLYIHIHIIEESSWFTTHQQKGIEYELASAILLLHIIVHHAHSYEKKFVPFFNFHNLQQF